MNKFYAIVRHPSNSNWLLTTIFSNLSSNFNMPTVSLKTWQMLLKPHLSTLMKDEIVLLWFNSRCRNMQNKPNRRYYEGVFNQMYLLISLLSNTMINISTDTNFEQIMVEFSINWLCKVFHQADFGLGFEKIVIEF